MKTKAQVLIARLLDTIRWFTPSPADPREAIALTRDSFNSVRKRSKNLRNQTAIATVLILAGHTCGISSGSGEQFKKLKADGYPFFHIDSEFSEFSCTA